MWRVGDGKSIDLWSDPWVGDEAGRFIMSEKIAGMNVVRDLMSENGKEWNIAVIESHFVERDQRCILAIPLSSRGLQDTLLWAYSKDGTYSVKTAYMLGKWGNIDDFHKAWGLLWSLEVSPKVRHFLWRVTTNSLPVRDALHRCHLVDESGCPWCVGEVETAQHAMFQCQHARQF